MGKSRLERVLALEKINNKQAVGLIITICMNMAILITNQVNIQNYQSASILNSIYSGILAILVTTIICFFYRKFVGKSILEISEFLGGKILKNIVGLFFVIYFLITMSALLCKIVDTLKIIYYPVTNNVYIILLFVISTGIICNFKNGAFIKTNYVIAPIAIFALIFVFIGNFKNYNFQNVFPILGNGFDDTFIKGASSIYTFSGIAYLYFLPKIMEKPDKFTKLAIYSIIISAIFGVLTISIISLMFNPKMIYGRLFPGYTVVRYIEFGTFFQRQDSAFLLIRIMAFICYMSIISSLILAILKNIWNLSDKNVLISPLMLTIFSITMVFDSYPQMNFIQNQVLKLLFFIICIFIGICVCFLAYLKKSRLERNDAGFE